MKTAHRWQAWSSTLGRALGGSSLGLASEQDPVHPTVEIFYDEAWHDISPYVLYANGITITRGRPDEASQSQPSSCNLSLNNRLGYFSPRNPLSPLFGKIGRNTQLRVSRVIQGSRFYRFTGEIVAWPQTWDTTGNDVRVAIQAFGRKRRLNQKNKALKSAAFREHTSPTRQNIIAYWSCEEALNAVQIAASLSNEQAMTITGTPTFQNYSDWKASDSLPTMGTGIFKGKVPLYAVTNQITFRIFCKVNTAVATTQRLMSLSTTGGVATWDVLLDSGGNLTFKGYANDGTVLLNSGPFAFAMNTSGMTMLVLDMQPSGSDISWRFFEQDLSNDLTVNDSIPQQSQTGTISSQTVGRATSVTIGADAGLGDIAVGHICVGNDVSAFANTGSALVAWNGENPGSRYERLCAEEGITQQAPDRTSHTNSVTMGWQGLSRLPDLLQEVVDTDIAADYETRDQFALAYRRRTTFYNQSAGLTLDYSAHELSATLTPVDDDQASLNDMTITRTGGSSAQYEDDTSALSVNDPPDGIGRYDDSKTLSLGTDDQCIDQAGWRVHMGTVNKPRFPTVTIQLAHPSFADYSMKAAALSLEIGDRIDVLNPPEPEPPDDIMLLVQGYTERFDQFLHEITFNCTPYDPWIVWILDDTTFVPRVDTVGSSLAQDYLTGAETSLQVSSSDTDLWTTDAADFPLDVMIGGEQVTVTNITGSLSPQTWTVTRSVNGVVKPQLAGTAVVLYQSTPISI